MSPTLLSQKTVTARKPRPCATCRTTAIQPGVQYVREVYVYDGRAYDWVSCQACNELANAVWQWSNRDEGIDADDYAEWADGHIDHPEHGEAARAYLDRIRTREGGE